MVELGGDPVKVNPRSQLTKIDHSVQVDVSGLFPDARERNLEIEYQRNMERYQFLKWGQQSLDNFRCCSTWSRYRPSGESRMVANVAREEEESG